VPKHRIAVSASALRPHERAAAKTDVTVFGDRCDELIAPVVVHPSAECVSTR
jgi:hypothetical protein